MYLISIYFDKQTEKRLQNLINRVAEAYKVLLDHFVPMNGRVTKIGVGVGEGEKR